MLGRPDTGPPGTAGSAATVNHSPMMDLVHWVGVALALPATAAVLRASWRAHLEGRSPHDA